MEFDVLGPLRVRRDGVDVALTGVLQRTLLAVLLIRAGAPVPVGVLTEALWPGQPGGPQKLQIHVSRLRRLLDEPDRIGFEHDAYRLRVYPGEVDAERFERVASEAAEADVERRAALAIEGLALWRGRPFADLDVPLLNAEAQRLAERRLELLELRYEAELRGARSAAVVADLTDLVREFPLRERLCGLLMIALYRSGRQADALAVFRATRRTLVDELGLEPGPELRAVEQQILAGEPVELRATVAGPVVPAQLPHGVVDFVGRDAELSELDGALAGSPICVLAGTGGVGKTALAVRWAHRVRDEFPDGQLYADLRGYGPREPAPPEEVLAGFLLALGVDREALPRGAAEREARFRTIVDGRRMLLVLDNARTAEQVRPLLPGTPSVFVLVTSRGKLSGLVVREGARRIDLGRLPADRSRELLVMLAGDRITGAEADTLVERCARLPLALRVAAELVRSRQESSAAELIAELADKQGQLDALDTAGNPQTSVRAVLSWSYQHLPADAARLFRLCGLHPGPVFSVHTLAALLGATPRETWRQVDLLAGANLLDRTPDGHYHPHDLLRAYADELVHTVDSDADRRDARSRLFGHYQCAASMAMDVLDPAPMFPRPATPTTDTAVPPFRDRDEALRWLDFERGNLVTTARFAAEHGWPRVSIHLSRALTSYLVGYVEEGTAVHTAARTAARECGDRLAEAHATRFIGNIKLHGGDLDGARDDNRRAHELFLAEGDRFFAGLSLNNIGWVQCNLGNYADALDCFGESRRLFESADDADRTGRGLASTGLGVVHLELGHLDDALAHLTAALEIVERAGNRRRESRVRMMLGSVYLQLGHYDQARVHGERAESIATEINDWICLTQLHDLGRIYWQLDRRADAYAALARTLDVAREHGMKAHESMSRLVLGELHLLDDRPDDAINDFRATLDLSAQTGARREQARALAGLGDAHTALGEHDTARDHWRRALAIFRDLDVPEAAEVLAKLE